MSEDKPAARTVALQRSLVSPGRMDPVLSMEGYPRMLGMLRDMRAEVQNLRRTLVELLDKETMLDSAIRAQEILTTLSRHRPLYDYNAEQITKRLEDVRSVMLNAPILYDRYGDEITHIENYWERATLNWPPPPNEADLVAQSSELHEKEDVAQHQDPVYDGELLLAAASEVLRLARQVVADLDALIYHVGLLTIPGRLNQHLEQLRIGQRLDFHATFADEVGNAEDRQRILDYLAARPVAVRNGIFDRNSGAVFHASASMMRRRMSYVYIILTFLLGAFLVVVIGEAGSAFDLRNWPVEPQTTVNLLVGYVFVIAGGASHITVDAIKQARSSKDHAFLAVDDWFTWIHINETGIITGIAWAFIGFIGVVFILDDVDWQTAFLVGYSIDSVVDTFLQRFNTTLTARTGGIVTS